MSFHGGGAGTGGARNTSLDREIKAICVMAASLGETSNTVGAD